MGIKDLMRWVQKHHPQVMTEYPHRWGSKELRGKRVAIDATLLTNRFHFAEKDVNARASTGIFGWYTMIREMRQHGVQPIAVWDERGDRPWKAPEARRRLEYRARFLARMMHEERRESRIARLRDQLVAYGCMSVREQNVIAQCWDLGRFLADDQAENAEPVVTAPLQTLTNQGIATAVVVANIVSRVAALSDLYEEHLVESKPIVTPYTSEHPTADAFEEEEEEVRRIALGLEDDSQPAADAEAESYAEFSAEAVSSEANPRLQAKSAIVAAAELLSNEQSAAVLDARLRCLPLAEYTESAKQRYLSQCEGEMYELAFGGPDVGQRLGGADDSAARLPAAMKILSEIEERMPAVKGVYTRALAVPREEHHAACRELLTRMGVPVVFARVPYEAEGLCAAMAMSGLVDFAGTEDSDVVVYGGPLLRNLSNTKMPLLLVDGATLASDVPLSPSAWRDFCILLGTDASPRIHRVGPARAYALIKKYGSIEAILKNEPELADRVDRLEPEFMTLIANARKLFTHLPPVEPVEKVEAMSDDDVVKWMRAQGVYIPLSWMWRGGEEGVERWDADERKGNEVLKRSGMRDRDEAREAVYAEHEDFGAEAWSPKELEAPPRLQAWED